MAEHYDNPAGRLRKLLVDLHAAYPDQNVQASVTAWGAVLRVVARDMGLAGEASLVSAVADLPRQIREGVAALDFEDDRKEHLLEHLDEIEQSMMPLLTRNSLKDMFNKFSSGGDVPRSAAIYALSHISYELHRSQPEQTMSEDDLALITAMIMDLMAEVASAQLPAPIKARLLHHLHTLLQAAHLARIMGTTPLTDSLFATAGAFGNFPEAQAELERAGVWERFKEAVGTLNNMLTTGQGIAQLGQGIAALMS